MKRYIALLLALALLFVGCSQKTDKASENKENKEVKTEVKSEEKAEKTEEKELVKVSVGVSPTPHGEIVEALRDEFKKEGIDVDVVVFTDYVQPNLALNDKEIDLNYFQHIPYLKEFCESRDLDLVSIANVHLEPIGLYTTKYQSIDEIEDGSEILIPNDPSNGARALRLLEDAGLIKLTDYNSESITENDIAENPKNLKITAVEAGAIPKAYGDVAAGVINGNYAIGAGLSPAKDALLLEKIEGNPNINVVAARAEDKDNEVYQRFVKVINSEAARKIIEEKFDGAVVPAF
ncbi:MAG: MetQ/NlpA family ABC transporter substrate-binding protein [Ezakiella sp.]|nr:MetQ/NlpA family ABC transporter substrate-binding protein [Ezakiella sp.]MDY3947166.1 MetQ/NlpA family ABC transporter substrate-binding protein [Ezakiella sp.]